MIRASVRVGAVRAREANLVRPYRIPSAAESTDIRLHCVAGAEPPIVLHSAIAMRRSGGSARASGGSRAVQPAPRRDAKGGSNTKLLSVACLMLRRSYRGGP